MQSQPCDGERPRPDGTLAEQADAQQQVAAAQASAGSRPLTPGRPLSSVPPTGTPSLSSCARSWQVRRPSLSAAVFCALPDAVPWLPPKHSPPAGSNDELVPRKATASHHLRTVSGGAHTAIRVDTASSVLG